MKKSCPLCQDSGSLFYEDQRHRFYSCPRCEGLFRDPDQMPGKQLEKERYLMHENSLDDMGYLRFVQPLLEAVKREMPKGSMALDYGCGHSPVISEVLKADGYGFSIFDPFFFPDKASLKGQYDFITCCEVAEHFHQPKAEFEFLYSLLTDKGKLFCMTYPYKESLDFGSWHYKNDLTHVFIYRERTLQYIAENTGFKDVEICGRVIVFSK